LQAETPVAHDVTPLWHWTDGVHVTPAVHEEQMPPLQT
jgi:hypothetical protein